MTEYWKSQPRKFCDFCKCWITDNKPSVDFHEKGKKHKENVQLKISQLRKKGLEDAHSKQALSDEISQMEKAALEAFKKDLANNPSLAAQYGVKLKAPADSHESEKEKVAQATCQPKPPSPKVPVPEQIEDSSITSRGESQGSAITDKGEWQEAVSPEGYKYYWNTVTGGASWIKPESFDSTSNVAEQKSTHTTNFSDTSVAALDASSKPTLDASSGVRLKAPAEDSTKEKTAFATHQPKLPSGKVHEPEPQQLEDSSITLRGESQASTNTETGEWQRTVSPEGYTYFWNTVTGGTSWVKPESSVPTSSVSQQMTTQNVALPADVPKAPSDPETIPLPANTMDIPLPTYKAASSSLIVRKPGSQPDDSPPSPESVDSDEDEITQALRKHDPPRERASDLAYGGWVSVEKRTEEPEMVDLELPLVPEPVETIPIPAVPVEPRPKFKEKRVASITPSAGESVGFKKRKLGSGARNVRQRDDS